MCIKHYNKVHGTQQNQRFLSFSCLRVIFKDIDQSRSALSNSKSTRYPKMMDLFGTFIYESSLFSGNAPE